MSDRTAIAVFVKYPEPGRVKTRLAATLGAEKAADAYETMARHVLGVLERLPPAFAPVLYADPFRPREDYERWLAGTPFPVTLQRGNDLGARLAAAFAELLATYPRALAVGTDCVELAAVHLESAARRLAAGDDVVLGPAEDGGYYLLGMSGFHAALFRDIPWSSPTVLAATLARAAEAGLTTARLPTLPDIDTDEDWRRSPLFR